MANLRNNPLFRLMKRISLFRRSGTASKGDLAKGLFITLGMTLLLNCGTLIEHPWWLLVWLAIVVPFVGGALLFHPFLSHRATLGENARSLFRRQRKNRS